MSTQLDETTPVVAVPPSETRPMYWSVRREISENRSIYIAPLIVTAIVLFGTFVSTASVPHRMQKLAKPDPARQQVLLVRPFRMAPAPIMFTTFLVGFFYCLDALYGERRDRSILFWKSLPVSDRTAVLAKASVPLVVLPLIALALSVATQIALLLLTTPILAAEGVSVAALWDDLAFFQGLPIMIYGLTVHALWFSPIYGWFLLVSAWARRAPLLWAVLPLVAAAVFEHVAFNTRYLMSLYGYRMTGAMREAFALGPKGDGDIHRISQLTPLNFLSTPGLWVGLLFAAAFVAGAVRLRRNREPI